MINVTWFKCNIYIRAYTCIRENELLSFFLSLKETLMWNTQLGFPCTLWGFFLFEGVFKSSLNYFR